MYYGPTKPQGRVQKSRLAHVKFSVNPLKQVKAERLEACSRSVQGSFTNWLSQSRDQGVSMR